MEHLLPGIIVWPLKPKRSNWEKMEKLEEIIKTNNGIKELFNNEDQRFFQSRRLLLEVMRWGNHKMLVDSWGWSDKIGDFRGLKQTAVFCLDAFARFWSCRAEDRMLERQCHHNEKNPAEWEEILSIHTVYEVLVPNYILNSANQEMKGRQCKS